MAGNLDAKMLDYRGVDLRFRDDFALYAAKLVRIRTKSGRSAPLVLNAAQRKLHAAIEKQRDEIGWARHIVLKGRQLGVSTYVCGRFYHRTTLWPNRWSYILTHLGTASDNLAAIVRGIHQEMPADYQPGIVKDNRVELFFDCGSGFRIGTAGNVSGAGRSMTNHHFHASEVPFWSKPSEQFSGAVETVPKQADTEIIIEATAKTIGDEFYNRWIAAERGQSDFRPLFLPWYLGEDYRQAGPDFTPTDEEQTYQELYGLDDEQLTWAHFKNLDLGGQPGRFCPLFRREYPAIAAEAFQMAGAESLIPGDRIIAARHWTAPDQRHMPRVLGVDVGRGGDQTTIIDRQGRRAGGLVYKRYNDIDLTVVADRVALLLRRHPDIRVVFIDVTGIGAGVVDILRNAFDDRVRGIAFGGSPTDPERYVNKRAEMWGRMANWLADPGRVQIPDEDDLHRDIAAPAFGAGGCHYDELGRLLLEKKDHIRSRLNFSPDGGDALALTFADTVPIEQDRKPSWRDELENPSSHESWMAA